MPQLPLPVAVLLQLFHVVAKVEHCNAHPVLSQKSFHLGNIRVRATNKDPQDVAARLHEGIERLDEAFEVSLVEQRLAVMAWKDVSNDSL